MIGYQIKMMLTRGVMVFVSVPYHNGHSLVMASVELKENLASRTLFLAKNMFMKLFHEHISPILYYELPVLFLCNFGDVL